MTPEEYQNVIHKALIELDEDEDEDVLDPQELKELKLVWFILELAKASETLLTLVREGLSPLRGSGLDTNKLKDEVSECLWFVVAANELLGEHFDSLIVHSAARLLDHYPEGFPFEVSRKQADKDEEGEGDWDNWYCC